MVWALLRRKIRLEGPLKLLIGVRKTAFKSNDDIPKLLMNNWDFIGAINRKEILAPVLSSMKDHVSQRYTSNNELATDLAAGRFDAKALLARLADRVQRPLKSAQEAEITNSIKKVVSEARRSAITGDGQRLTKMVLNRLNDIIIPALYRDDGLGFDSRSHRALLVDRRGF